MGDDYGNYQVFCSHPDHKIFRENLVEEAHRVLLELGYSDDGATRVLAIGPPSRWIAIFDSTDDYNPPYGIKPFSQFAQALSRLTPVVTVDVSDSAIFSLKLYRDGELQDHVANGFITSFSFFSDRRRSLSIRGKTELMAGVSVRWVFDR